MRSMPTATSLGSRTTPPPVTVVSFNHTEIYPAFEGFGLAGVLVRQALDDLRARGLKVHPVCPYVVKFLDKHPEYQDLIS